MKKAILQFTRFSIVGSASALVNYMIILAGVEVYGFSYITAKVPGFFISLIFNYVLNSNMTFQVSARGLRQLTRYLSVLLSGFLLNMLFSKLVVVYMIQEEATLFVLGGQNIKWYMVVEIFMTLAFTFWNFFGHKFWSFRNLRRN